MDKLNNNHFHCKTYEVKLGDNLSTIAVNHGTNLKPLLSLDGNEWLNNNPSLIQPGDIIHLKDHVEARIIVDYSYHLIN